MKLFSFNPSKGVAVVAPEDAEDLWALRRVLAPGDRVAAATTRVVKREGEYVRPDKGERVRVLVTLRVQDVKLDSGLERLRISGVIEEASDEILSRGSYHSVVVTADSKITLVKDEWTSLERRLLSKGDGTQDTFYLVAIDRREAAIGVVKGTRLQVYPTRESGVSGKAYRQERASLDGFFGELVEELSAIYRGGRVIAVGPGNTKNALVNRLLQEKPDLEGAVQIVEGIDTAGEDGVLMAIRSEGVRQLVKDSKMGKASALLDEAVRRISRGNEKIALSFRDSGAAAEAGAVESALVSNKVFERHVPEEELMAFLNKVEARGGRVLLVDSSSSVGTQVSGLGGVVCLLRFSVRGAG